MLASILTEAGYRVGLFTSPHIKDFTERIRINGTPIDQNSVVEFIQKIKAAELDFAPSFFEVTFIMALEYFKKEQCDVCIIETGLGGRLDSTNIITPLLSIITNISLEHTQILGDTIEKIAFEKGGIIKERVPIVLGKMNNEADFVLKEIAQTQQSEVYPAHISALVKNSLLGEHQTENLATVLTACEVLQKQGFKTNAEDIQNGLDHLNQNTGFIGRMQVISENPTVIFDVSHNPDGIQKTIAAVQKIAYQQLHIIYGTSADKDAQAIVQLFPADAKLYFTEFTNERSMKAEALKQLNPKAQVFTAAQEALTCAKENANPYDLILVTGSFFLLGDLV